MTLDEIRKLIAEATPTPWVIHPPKHDKDYTSIRDEFGDEITWVTTVGFEEANARFIAAARTLLPALLAAVEDMADELQAAKDGDSYVCKAESVDRLISALEALKLP